MKKCPDYVTCIAIDLPKFGISDDLSINGVSNSEICVVFAEIIAAATGEEVTSKVHQQVIEAVAAPADPVLDAIEARLNVAESKVDSLLGK